MIRASQKKGFTIVELLIVVVVIAILAAIIIVSYNGIQLRAKDVVLQSNVNRIQQSIEIYFIKNGTYPRSANYSVMGLNDSTGVWPSENMEGMSKDLHKSPFDTSGAPTSMREEAGWEESGHGTGGKIGYVSVIADDLQVKGGPNPHWTCFWSSDICTGWRIWYRTSSGELKTVAGGTNPPAIAN